MHNAIIAYILITFTIYIYPSKLIINWAPSRNDQIYCHSMSWWNHCVCEHKSEVLAPPTVKPHWSKILLQLAETSDLLHLTVILRLCENRNITRHLKLVMLCLAKNIRVEHTSQTRDCFMCLCINLKQNYSHCSVLKTTMKTANTHRDWSQMHYVLFNIDNEWVLLGTELLLHKCYSYILIFMLLNIYTHIHVIDFFYLNIG